MASNVEQLSPQELGQFQLISQQAARAGGSVLKELMGAADSWEKNPGDFVTEADFKSQTVIRKALLEQFPDHSFLGEEDENREPVNPDKEFCWIVDPLDGTTNYVHQLPAFSVSIALRYRDQVIVGTVFDPLSGEMYSAAWGQGATCNEAPLRVSSARSVDRALVVFSMNSRLDRNDPQTLRLLNVMENAHTVRRLGSAALNFCLLAAGRIDAYFATSLKIWDVAAGLLIATEAGAVLDSFDDRPFDLEHPRFCCAATQELFDDLKPLLDLV